MVHIVVRTGYMTLMTLPLRYQRILQICMFFSYLHEFQFHSIFVFRLHFVGIVLKVTKLRFLEHPLSKKSGDGEIALLISRELRAVWLWLNLVETRRLLCSVPRHTLLF